MQKGVEESGVFDEEGAQGCGKASEEEGTKEEHCWWGAEPQILNYVSFYTENQLLGLHTEVIFTFSKRLSSIQLIVQK